MDRFIGYFYYSNGAADAIYTKKIHGCIKLEKDNILNEQDIDDINENYNLFLVCSGYPFNTNEFSYIVN